MCLRAGQVLVGGWRALTGGSPILDFSCFSVVLAQGVTICLGHVHSAVDAHVRGYILATAPVQVSAECSQVEASSLGRGHGRVEDNERLCPIHILHRSLVSRQGCDGSELADLKRQTQMRHIIIRARVPKQ